MRLRPSVIDRDALREWFGGQTVGTYAALGREFGVEDATIRQSWVPAGMPGAGSREYDLAEVGAWRLEHLDRIESKQRTVQELNERELKRRTDEAEARKLEAQAHRLEFDNERERGDWMRISDVQAAISSILAVLNQRLMDFPHKLAPSLPEEQAKTVVPFMIREIGKQLTWCAEELRRKVVGD